MIWFLRHISIRLWFTSLISMPVSFFLVFKFNSVATGFNPIILFVLIVFLIFASFGFILDFLGKKLIDNFIKQGTAWERAEIYKRSEEKYYKALRIYDSFLISPFSAKACAEKLSEAIAKFMAISKISDTTFEKASTLFLKLSPNDEHMALIWLKKLFHTQDLELKSMDHDILTLIAENHYKNKKILPLLTNIFIQLARTDFTAQKVYKEALTYLKKESKKRLLIQDFIREPEEEKEIPSKLSFAKTSSKKPQILNLFKNLVLNIVSTVKTILFKLQELFHLSTSNRKLKIYFKFSIIFLSFFIAIFLMYNVLSSLLKSQTKKVELKQAVIEAPVPKLPYTIQIAAFLKQPHAEDYTKKLKKIELDARFIKVEGKSKTWFLVRISQFETKSSAAAYGQKLKREGLIKDFFVANK